MRHMAEEELIAYQLHESSDEELDESFVREHLEQCPECADRSESIAETLRIFSADVVPQANIEHAWQRLRGNLGSISPEPRRRFGWLRERWMWRGLGMAVAAMLVVAVLAGVHVHRSASRLGAGLGRDLALQRTGPLTERPADPEIAGHLDSAERLLTEVNHANGPLDDATRAQARSLLLKNAVYVQEAHAQGDLAQASVLENLGRVLTTMDHEPPPSDKVWHIRFEMNTDGLLLDIRILQQNDNRQ